MQFGEENFNYGKIENVAQTWTIGSDGLVTVRVTEYCDGDESLYDFDPANMGFWGSDGWGGTGGPIGMCVGGTCEQLPEGVWKVTKTFQGVPRSIVTWRVSGATNQEPIESHIYWDEGSEDNCPPSGMSDPVCNSWDAEGNCDGYAPAQACASICEYGYKIGGNGADPQHLAIFKPPAKGKSKATAKFDHFPSAATCDLAGVKAYLDPTCQLEKTTLRPHDPDISGSVDSGGSGTSGNFDPDWDSITGLATIFDSLAGQPDISAGRNWLMMGSTQEVVGGAIRIKETFRLSGRKGWNKLVYPTSVDAGSGGSGGSGGSS